MLSLIKRFWLIVKPPLVPLLQTSAERVRASSAWYKLPSVKNIRDISPISHRGQSREKVVWKCIVCITRCVCEAWCGITWCVSHHRLVLTAECMTHPHKYTSHQALRDLGLRLVYFLFSSSFRGVCLPVNTHNHHRFPLLLHIFLQYQL